MTLIVITWLACAMLASAIYAYRDHRDEGAEIVGIVFLPPLGLAYQIGRLLRERRP